VNVFRHYILVSEGVGNAVRLLKVHHSRFNEFIFVTQLLPVKGIQLTGHMSVSPMGYLWYTFQKLPSSFGVASVFLAEPLRESPPRRTIEDVTSDCQNDTWYNKDLLDNTTMYIAHIGYMLNASQTNWLFPDLPGFVDIFVFNKTRCIYSCFDLELLNETVLGGGLVLCNPTVPSTTPAMLSGDTGGWSGSTDGVIRAGAAQQRPPQWLILASAAAAWAAATAAAEAAAQKS